MESGTCTLQLPSVAMESNMLPLSLWYLLPSLTADYHWRVAPLFLCLSVSSCAYCQTLKQWRQGVKATIM